jgi:hypothetical protein
MPKNVGIWGKLPIGRIRASYQVTVLHAFRGFNRGMGMRTAAHARPVERKALDPKEREAWNCPPTPDRRESEVL